MGASLAIVGLGPWGLCVLERLLAHLHAAPPAEPVSISVVEEGVPGAGVHAPDLPGYLLLNTPCGQLCLFGGRHLTDAPPGAARGMTFLEWVRARGYRFKDGDVVADGTGREIRADDFLPRRLLGAYLAWGYEVLASRLPPGVSLALHRGTAVAVRRQPDGREVVETADGARIAADHVVLTTGHTAAVRPATDGPRIQPYDREALSAIRPGATVAVAGLGLVAVDVVTALTTGRGGRFVGEGPRTRYQPSGEEPRLVLFSRNGLPFCCRPATALDTSGRYEPAVLTPARIDAMRAAARARTGSPQLEFTPHVLPLVLAEMVVLFHERSALLRASPRAAEEVRARLAAAWEAGRFDAEVRACEGLHGRFDPAGVLWGPNIDTHSDGDAYAAMVEALLREDLAESEKGEQGSPRKAAVEVFRILRDTLRYAVDLDGLSARSGREFRDRVAPAINRVVVGPPVRRGWELLALMEAGTAVLPLGPSPRVSWQEETGRWRLASTRLAAPRVMEADHLVTGYLGQPDLRAGPGPLLSQLQAAGRIRPFRIGAWEGGVDVGPDGRVLNADGVPEPGLTVLGPPVDGPRYFNHYVPSPRSRARAFLEADAWVRSVLPTIAARPRSREVA